MDNPSLAESSSVTPLNVISAVALDTETTGLDIKSARLLQIGAVRIKQGRICREQTFDTLIFPGIPIPPESTMIHGINDDDVATALPFSQIKNDLDAWIGQAIVIGFSIGFDLAILKKETERANLIWYPPRTIDVRHLVKIISPELPDYSLETIANWLNIELENRHRALGDAVIAAQMYQTLVPKLIDKGIRTVAELEVACRIGNNDAVQEAQAGWYDFLTSNTPQDVSQRALARIDSYPFRHRVRDVMSSPPVIVNSDTILSEVLSIMIKQHISSVFVHEEGAKEKYGILTERDILRAINKSSTIVLSQPVSQHCQFPLHVVPEDSFLYRAMGRMTRNNFRHLGVKGKHHELIGALSSRDLLKQRSDDALDLGDAINQASTADHLATIWAKLAIAVSALDNEEVDVIDIAAVISGELCALTRRACEIAEQELGDPPVPYTMVVLGSGGRGESLLAMDQDNAIIYDTENFSEDNQKWFESLGSRVADLLNASGVPYCKGGVMAKNPEWCKSLSNWKQEILIWINRTSPEDILKTDIFFDATTVHGPSSLTENLLNFAYETCSQSRNFMQLMAINASEINSALGLFGRFKTHNGRIEVKLSGILPIVSAARVEAIRNKIHEASTPQRLELVGSVSDKPKDLFENLIAAHQIILNAILKQQMYDIKNGIPLSNRVNPKTMLSVSRSNLRWALERVHSIKDIIGIPINT